jgi:tRNA-Thr(GGU) m(6)t(6)A37 methyltransferase TsaA
MEIVMKPIGIIHSPYKECKNIPIQARYNPEVNAWIELNKRFSRGLKDLEKFSHAFLLYYFHQSKAENLLATPFLEKEIHGIFAIRSPHRPNHIGMSIVRLNNITGNKIFFTEVDMIDGTPLLDIKPYVPHFDHREKAVGGWVDKHFLNGTIPANIILK